MLPTKGQMKGAEVGGAGKHSSPTCMFRRGAFKRFENLPIALKTEILSHLDREDLLNSSGISKGWRTLARDEFLWRRLWERDSESFGRINPDLFGEHGEEPSWREKYKKNYPRYKVLLSNTRCWCTRCQRPVFTMDILFEICMDGELHQCLPMTPGQISRYVSNGDIPAAN
ncbi:unnamed protein product [Lactuca saligna]|uniref:F-box domain-containing protein n=1 Tax=Lactuca saligna TaxID=75948 RepID=A0AA35Y6F2_LACSI|nr:unnamed protein product [Lactuca saligna]